jgi:putative membrane protein
MGAGMTIDTKFINTKAGKTIYVACVTVLLSGIGSWAVLAHQDEAAAKKETPASAKAKTTVSDAHFVKEAAQGGMAEVKLGQLAQEKGASESVKKFGKRMEDDHSKANDKLKEAASKENIPVPSDIGAKNQANYDRLSKLSGAAFDRAYANDMVKDHQTDVAAFQKEANAGKNDSIKRFASETLPTLQDHLKEAKEMQKSVTASHTRNSKARSGR